MTHSADRAPRTRAVPVRILAIALFLLVAVVAVGCVYRINIQQGNFLDPKAVEQLTVGMTRSQVRYLLGTPMVPNAFDTDRWDYFFYYKTGAPGKRSRPRSWSISRTTRFRASRGPGDRPRSQPRHIPKSRRKPRSLPSRCRRRQRHLRQRRSNCRHHRPRRHRNQRHRHRKHQSPRRLHHRSQRLRHRKRLSPRRPHQRSQGRRRRNRQTLHRLERAALTRARRASRGSAAKGR